MRIILTKKIRRIIFISAVIIILGLTSMVNAQDLTKILGARTGNDYAGIYEIDTTNISEWVQVQNSLLSVNTFTYSNAEDRILATRYKSANNIYNLYNASSNTTWVENSIAFSSAVTNVAFGDGKFMIGGNYGTLGYIEEDGETITYITTNNAYNVDGLWFDGNIFLVLFNKDLYRINSDYSGITKINGTNTKIYPSGIIVMENMYIFALTTGSSAPDTTNTKWYQLNTENLEVAELVLTNNTYTQGGGECETANDDIILCYHSPTNSWWKFNYNGITGSTFTQVQNGLRPTNTNSSTGSTITSDDNNIYWYSDNPSGNYYLYKYDGTSITTELTSSRYLSVIAYTKKVGVQIPTYTYEVEYNTNGSANLVFTFTNYINNPQYTFYIGNLSTQYLFDAIPKTENSYRIDNIYGNSVYRFVLYDDITDVMISEEMIDIATELKKVSTPYVKILDYSTNTTFNWNWFNLDDYQQALDNEFNGGENDYPKAYCYYKEYKNGSVYQSPINNCVSISGNGYYTTEFIGDNGYLEVVFSYKKDAESLNYEELYRQQFNFTGDKTLPYIEITSLNNGDNGLVVNINVFNVVATDKIQYSKDNGATWNTLGYGDAEYSLNFMYNTNIIVRIVDVDDVELVRASYDVIVDYETYTNGSTQATNLNTILETLRSIFGMENTTNTAMGNLWNKVSNSYVFMFLFTNFIGTVIIYIVVILRRS